MPSPQAGEPAHLSLPAPSPPRPATGVIAPRDRSAAWYEPEALVERVDGYLNLLSSLALGQRRARVG